MGHSKRLRASGLLLAVGAIVALALLGGSLRALTARGFVDGSSGVPDTALTQNNPAPAAAAVGIDLCAKTGTLTMPDSVIVPIWGFALGNCTVAGAATVPGPVLDVTVGDVVTLTLYNSLSESVALSFSGQGLVPDTVGAAPATGSTTYTFTATDPGTYLYESNTNAQVQVAMGLFGALIVRPVALGQAYDDIDSAFDDEALLVLSEVDPVLNASPGSFNFLDYSPKYWLINGEAYPDTDAIHVLADDRLLVRYVNAGLMPHTVQTLGFDSEVYARDADPLKAPHQAVAVTGAAGQTWDTLVDVPSAAPGTRFPIYSAQQHVTNVASFPGGMLTFLMIDGVLGLAADCVSAPTMADALRVAMHVVGLGVDLACAINADANYDGVITMADALVIAKYVVGLP